MLDRRHLLNYNEQYQNMQNRSNLCTLFRGITKGKFYYHCFIDLYFRNREVKNTFLAK